MRIGKLTNKQLKGVVLSKLKHSSGVLLYSGIGEDCAALDFNGQACVLSTDPITGTSKNIGTLAVNISANDVASSGARPSAMLVTLLVPPDKTIEDVEHVIDETIAAADSLGIDIIGGHTEVTDAVNRIVISTTVVGRISSGKLIKSSGARPGDDIIMTKYAGLEGTYIIAHEYKDRLDLTDEELDAAYSLGASISVIDEGMMGASFGASAMHDITEGGVYGAVHELCEASGVGCDLYKNSIQLLDVTRKICSTLDIDPCMLIGSGSMIITASDSSALMEALNNNGIKASVIGKITADGMRLVDDGKTKKIPMPKADALFCI